MRIEFRWEFFNFFNHANLGGPVVNVSSNTAGRITSTSAPRIMQLGLRFVF